MVHAVGFHPLWPWGEEYEQFDNLPDAIFRCYSKKCEELKRQKADIDKKLFCSTLVVDGNALTSIMDAKSQPALNVWFVIQCWRDWFASKIAQASAWKSDKDENHTGVMYRIMAKGGDAYLPADEVVVKLRAIRGEDAPLSLEEALKKVDASRDGKKLATIQKVDGKKVGDWLLLLKRQAQAEVEPLCVNHSLLSVEEAGIKVSKTP